MAAGPLLPKSRFVGLEQVAHLCTGGEAPWLHSHDDACRRFGQLKSAGMAGRDAIFDVYTRAKQQVAALLGISADRVAFLAHASEGLNQAIAATLSELTAEFSNELARSLKGSAKARAILP